MFSYFNSAALRASFSKRCGSPSSPLDFAPLSEHWDYHLHPHPHPVEFENLPETNFTELQSVQALHPPCHAVRYETENLIDPNLAAHPHVLQPSVSLGSFCWKEQFALLFFFSWYLALHSLTIRNQWIDEVDADVRESTVWFPVRKKKKKHSANGRRFFGLVTKIRK